MCEIHWREKADKRFNCGPSLWHNFEWSGLKWTINKVQKWFESNRTAISFNETQFEFLRPFSSYPVFVIEAVYFNPIQTVHFRRDSRCVYTFMWVATATLNPFSKSSDRSRFDEPHDKILKWRKFCKKTRISFLNKKWMFV